MSRVAVWPRAASALLAVLCLVGALGGALVRAGALPAMAVGPAGSAAITHHGALMMAGFFGSLIALERAVALHRGLWVPLLAAVAGVALWLGAPVRGVGTAWVASAAGLVALYAHAARHRAVSLPLAVEATAAVMLLAGSLAWTLGDAATAKLAWSSFLVLTIAGERRELTQLVRLGAAARASFVVLVIAMGVAVALQAAGAAIAPAAWWATAGSLALWLARCDIAPRQRRAAGWAGHTAWCLTVGYGWLALAALLGLAGHAQAWHALWLGFVFAMVFGHAPIMLPALAGWRPQPTRWALVPLGVMGASLAWRIAAGLTAVAALAHIAALLLFAGVMAHAVRAQRGS